MSKSIEMSYTGDNSRGRNGYRGGGGGGYDDGYRPGRGGYDDRPFDSRYEETESVEYDDDSWSWCNMFWSMIASCCCPLFGFFAVILAILSYADFGNTRFRGSQRKRLISWILAMVAIIIGMALVSLVLVFIFVNDWSVTADYFKWFGAGKSLYLHYWILEVLLSPFTAFVHAVTAIVLETTNSTVVSRHLL